MTGKAGLGRLLAAMVLLLTGTAWSQTLSVNGSEVEGLTLELVPGVSYAPAGSYASALGAGLSVDYGSSLVTLELGGRIVVLPTLEDASNAGTASIHVNGAPRDGRPAVFDQGRLYLPVSVVAQAFLGYTSYVPSRERVMVVLPRGRFESVEVERRGSSERLVLNVVGNVPYSLYYNSPLRALEVTFDRTDASGLESLAAGRNFTRAAPLLGRGSVTYRINLDEEVDYQVFTAPAGRGYQLVVDLFEGSGDPEASEPAPLVVIDPGHGGSDRGMILGDTSESELTLALALELADALERRGLRVLLSREGDQPVPLATRSGLGVGADLFLSLHVHVDEDDLASVYYLAEAEGNQGLDLAIRQNAQAELTDTTDVLRRRLLLNLVPDVDVGRGYAQTLQSELLARTSVRAAEPTAAPLAVLSGAAGRGLMLELPDSVDTDGLAQPLADVLDDLLDGSRERAGLEGGSTR